MKITNYAISKFLTLEEAVIKDYVIWLQHVNPIANLKKGNKTYGVKESLTELKYREVSELKRHVGNRNFESISRCIEIAYKLNKKQIERLPIVTFYGCVNFIVKQMEMIYNMERVHYAVESDEDDYLLEEAGSLELQKFEDLPIIDTLANGVILDYDKIEELPYIKVHVAIWYRTTRDSVKKKYEKLITKKLNH
ncbi:hypothetical protein [Capnocytophaga canis]|uniref:hypothetical protein n=1 Tax=Capnocytophaga canis TaxID=1848903 RepID=UPI0037D6956A